MPNLDDVVAVAIHPAIGIARVGNSREAFFIGPESPGVHPLDGTDPRDRQGALKRQAARFRVFGLDAQGRVIAEVTADDAKITWTVHVANKKAAWYDFAQAFDIPASKGEIQGVAPLKSALRNSDVTGSARAGLIVDPGPRTLESTASGAQRRVRFDTGRFLGTAVDLGEAHLEPDGALVVLGGLGHSASPQNKPIVDFANNPGWFDDVSDGTIDATVEIGGRRLSAIGSWVIVGPPNYAPGITPFVTGWDLVYDVMMGLRRVEVPSRPTFGEHIQPALQRVSIAQWVNSGFAIQFGWGSPADFLDPDLLRRLNDPGTASRPLRQAVFAWFRNPRSTILQADRVPAVYGDAILLSPRTRDPLEWMAIPESQYDWLRRWANGDFTPGLAPPPRGEGLSPAERAAALDRAALEDCCGGPFHPGIEFTWPLRQPMLYDARQRFRIKRRTAAEPALPAELTSSFALAAGGPLDGSVPGDITRWMALPWQGDTASCLSAYEDFSGEYVPTFWPARVPNDVLTEDAYRVLMDRGASPAQREAAFATPSRRKWLRGVSYSNESTSQPNMLPGATGPQRFVTSWPDIGVVMRREGPDDLATLPREIWVESHRRAPAPPTPARAATRAEDAVGGPPVSALRSRMLRRET